ncbi:hypothetical protein E1265_21340 [Streptomyces sp. 8K308]|uniref:hypothetical protein n=1 Tax=Streptomyces sp. 8K308 TaxID=2530388 RepID=UPI00104C4069|nr:hypothetical protein [Streptomyces sp. 8K308]TDC20617.1 hypothetical protein E1265_21340 [Streptomyces sp. 8K308]
MTTPTKAPTRRTGQNAQQQAPVARAFRIGVQSHEEINYDETRTLGASTIDLPVLNVPPAGFLRNIYLVVEGTTAGNAAAVTFAEDGPFNVIDSITLEDVNSAPIVGPISGYDLYVINKYGGYRNQDDPKMSPVYSAVTGSGATGGSFAFVLKIPIELVNRDALGALPNKSGTAMFKVRIRIAPNATVYGTAPTAAGSVRVRMAQVDWWDPDAQDLRGRPLAQNPPAVQTTQYWSKAVFNVNSGAIRQQLERVGYLVRNLIFITEDTNSSRLAGDANFPDPFTFQFEANTLLTRNRVVWRHMIAEDFGYNAAAESAGGRDNGVYPLPFNLDFGLKPGAESRRGYLPTSAAARLEVQGNMGGAGTLTVLTNDVAPANGDDAQLTV